MRMMPLNRAWRRAALSVLVLLTACGTDETVVNATAPLTSTEVLAAGPFAVGVRTMEFNDPSRPTMANGDFPGAASRRLLTEVWYPTDVTATPPDIQTRDAPLAANAAPFPLIVYSHGFMSTRTGGAYLARQLASRGYVVAAPDFPLSNFDAPGGATLTDVVEQPADVSFVIDRLLALSAAPASWLAAGIDPARIGLSGLSLGGMTTLLVTYHRSLRDERVRAAAVMAGPGCIFSQSFFGDRRLPLLLVHGDIDAIVPYMENARVAYGVAGAPKYLLTFLGGSHTGFADGMELFDGFNNLDDLGCAALGGGQLGDGVWPSEFLDRLGGAAAGVVAGACPFGCGAELPPSLRAGRQQALTLLGVVPFFEATLRQDQRARRFLEETLVTENAEAHLEFAR